MFNTVYKDVYPVIESKYSDKLQIIFRQQVGLLEVSDTGNSLTIAIDSTLASLLDSRPRSWSSGITNQW